MSKKVIAILGMHRSGTSLITSWLQDCGLHVGDRLLEANIGNDNGHFEDLDFLSFHEGLFLKNSLNHLNAKSDKILIDDIDISLANEIIKNKLEDKYIFGWKDPRTCIFLNNIWSKVDYDIHYLFIYRSFGQIINSLYNRHIKKLFTDYKYQLISNSIIKKLKNNLYIKLNRKSILEDFCTMYINYMEEILKFYDSNGDKNKFMAVNINSAIINSLNIINTINNNWSISLKSLDLGLKFKENQFNTTNINLKDIDRRIVEKCRLIDKKLYDLTINKNNQPVNE